jgi:hypothetical protein
MHLRINLMKLTALLLTIMLIICTAICAVADTGAETESSVAETVSSSWAYAALLLSEILAFLPTKFAGICKSAFTVISSIFSKKK